MGVFLILNEAKKYFANIAHQIYQKGLTPGKSGNISTRILIKEYFDDEIIFITPSGVSLRDLNTDNIIVTDLNGVKLEGDGQPSSELNMHLTIYRSRRDVKAIIHTHSTYATGFSFSDKKIPRLEGYGEIKEPHIPDVKYATPGSDELVHLASSGLKNSDMLILKKHGVVAVGPDLDEALLLSEFTESCAKIGFITHLLNK